MRSARTARSPKGALSRSVECGPPAGHAQHRARDSHPLHICGDHGCLHPSKAMAARARAQLDTGAIATLPSRAHALRAAGHRSAKFCDHFRGPDTKHNGENKGAGG